MKALVGFTTAISTLGALPTIAASPKVLGLTFERSGVQNNAETNLLRKRQDNTLAVNIDNAEIAYVINMTLGTPPQMFSVQLDTGSADIWVPAVTSDVCSQSADACSLGAFDPDNSSSFRDGVIDTPFQISYEDNSGVQGEYINETLTVGKVTIKQMTLGLALRATRPAGIMGIGYNTDESITAQDPDFTYPNIVNQLKDQGYINTVAYSLWLNDPNSLEGSILFGGIDTAKFTGPLTVLPIQRSSGGGFTDITVVLSSLSLTDNMGRTQFEQDNLALPVILDSGTTATYVPDDMAQQILDGVGAINSNELGMIIPCSFGASTDTFAFGFGGAGGPTINVSFSEFVMPIYDEEGNTYQFPHTKEDVCGWGLLSSGPPGGPILLGDTFLRSAYVVYDLENNQVGIAQTDFNATDSNVVEISGTAIPSAASTATGAAVTQTYTGHPLQQGQTRAGGAQFTGKANTPTFNLGLQTTAASRGVAISPSSGMGTLNAVTCAVVLLSMLFGGSLIMRI